MEDKNKRIIPLTRSEKKWDNLTDDELSIIQSAIDASDGDENIKIPCPDCREALIPGPCGGMSQNFFCSNTKTCGSKFNLTFAAQVEGKLISGSFHQRISDRCPSQIQNANN